MFQERFDHLRLIIERIIYMWLDLLIRQQILSTDFQILHIYHCPV